MREPSENWSTTSSLALGATHWPTAPREPSTEKLSSRGSAKNAMAAVIATANCSGAAAPQRPSAISPLLAQEPHALDASVEGRAPTRGARRDVDHGRDLATDPAQRARGVDSSLLEELTELWMVGRELGEASLGGAQASLRRREAEATRSGDLEDLELLDVAQREGDPLVGRQATYNIVKGNDGRADLGGRGADLDLGGVGGRGQHEPAPASALAQGLARDVDGGRGGEGSEARAVVHAIEPIEDADEDLLERDSSRSE